MTTPMSIPLHILENITNGFSGDLLIGKGGYGNVYKGVYNGKVIAVKLLHDDLVQIVDDKHFSNEVFNLLRVAHPNIVWLCGYCYETRHKYVEHNGENVFGKHIYRVLCFEYLQGGSLDNHLRAPSLAPSWSTRYTIIKGICEGLNFLHKCEPPIFHLDLKPANILLDSSMRPKLADFGLSRLFRGSHTHITTEIIGTQKYMPPEFIKDGKISVKNDVFSLGIVIIEIMAGPTGYSDFSETGDSARFVEEVLKSWSTTIEATSKYPSEELHQVNTCIETAIRCVDSERNNRPTMASILDALNKTETHLPFTAKQTHIPEGEFADPFLCSKIGPKMTAEVDNITNKNQHSNCMRRDSFNTIVQQAPDRETSSDVESTSIFGRNEEKNKILSILSKSNTEEMAILPIYGIGGIGKTTLAQLVFNDTHFQGYSRVWVYVSQKFDLNKIGNSIISQLTNQYSHIAETQMLHNRLVELFACKSILIVLDDLWEEKPQELDRLKAMLRPRVGRKVVIVTTRDEAIARKISRIVMPYKLNILTDDMCWTIIKHKSCFEDKPDKTQLEQIGRDIAIKCGGVALAAQSLGYMLRDMESDQWKSVRESYIWDLSTAEDPSLGKHEVLVSLLLSYSHMHEFLQLSFSYCAVFQKGHNIVKYDLIHQWIALGFTGPSSIFDSIQLCEKYITQLLGMSFLQHSKTHSSDERQYKAGTLFTMHDLVHDLARAILADQVNDMGNAGGKKCRYALLTDCTKPLQLSVSSPANIRAVHFLNCRGQEPHADAFSLARCLHVLDLGECFLWELPDCVCQLKHLRYLRAPKINNWMIPDCITELAELNYLNLTGSYISALPESMGDMKGLMHFDLSGCHGIHELPLSFAELKQLVHLDLSHCHVSISDETLGGFTKLRYLNLSVKLYISANRRGITEVMSNLIELRYLNLSGCLHVMATSNDQIDRLFGSISSLSNLEHLDLSDNLLLSSIPESMGNLRKLHTLDLSRCLSLKKLPDSMVNMVSLKVLNVGNWVILNELVLSQLNIASLPHFVVHDSSDKRSSNIIRLRPTNPVELTIDRLENVKSAEEAQSLELMDKRKIKELTFQWTVAAKRFVDDKHVLEKLVPPRGVQIFNITGYMSATFPDWLMGISQYLPNLSQIVLCNFPKCNALPPLGQLPNLQQLSLIRMVSLTEWNTKSSSGEEGVNVLMFPKLETLSINGCAKLRIKPYLPRVMSLSINNCDNVLSSWGESSSSGGPSSYSPIHDLKVTVSKVPLHSWRLLRQLPALRSLTISGCSDLTTSPEIIKHLSSLQSLSFLLESNDPAELPRWLFELTNLLELNICHPKLQQLDENTRKLTRLQKLSLSWCDSMTSLPQWVGELTSLVTFEISFCKGIRSLPDSIQKLAKLENLNIHHCSTLQDWCELEENKMKLGHIRRVSIW